jgi:hypothetical protein
MTTAPTTAADACMACTGLCETCPAANDLDWPPADRETTAALEAAGLPYAGADAPRPAAVDDTWERHRRWRNRLHNRHTYGTGGLFDHLEASA